MSDPRKSETQDQRVRLRINELMDPDLCRVLSNHSGSKGCRACRTICPFVKGLNKRRSEMES